MLITAALRPLPASSCPFRPEGAAAPLDRVELTTPGPAAPTDKHKDLGPCHGWLDKPPTPPPMVEPGAWENAKHYDVVVVGAGMSGLHTAWRLRGLDGSAPPEGSSEAPSVAVFERTRHVGGRARSKKVEGAPIPFDLGAMRFIPSQHHLVNGLVERFQLPTREFVVGGEQNLQYFRGKRHTNAEVAADPSVLPFNLRAEEQGKSASQLLEMAIEAVVPGFRCLDEPAWEQARQTATVDGMPLAEMGLQNVLSHSLSKEAVTLITESVGYQTFLANWDAGQALHDLAADFSPGTEYRTPEAGMEALPRALAGELRKAGTDMHFTTALRRVDYDQESGKFRLTFENRDGALPVLADKLVLAMPKKPLDELVRNSPALRNTTLESNLGKVTPNPMTRIFATFDQPWWREQGIVSGRSLTDLELGQVYYYGGEGDRQPFIQAYADGTDSAYWEGLQNPSHPGVSTSLCATPQLAGELKAQLEEMHGREIPNPTGLLYKRWSDPFTGGAYHTWNPGTRPWEASEAMLTPVDGQPVYVCGEAFSTTQGWIEGALQTSEKVLQKLGKEPTARPA